MVFRSRQSGIGHNLSIWNRTLLLPNSNIASVGFYVVNGEQDFYYYQNTEVAFASGLNEASLHLKLVLDSADQMTMTLKCAEGTDTCVPVDNLTFTQTVDDNRRIYDITVDNTFINAVLGTSSITEGHYQVSVGSSGDCSDGFTQVLHFIVTPDNGYSLSFHFNNHLGSTVFSETYSTFGNENLIDQALTIDGQLLLPTGKDEIAYLTPYGNRPDTTDATSQSARYTDHEWDKDTGLNYMKGRFQLARYGKMNRPDPMRDWDWLRPHTLNLYEYVGNDPINMWDPTGLIIKESTDLLKDQLYMQLKEAYLETDAGQELWNNLEQSDAVFNIQFGDMKDTQFAVVNNYVFDESDALLSADINFSNNAFTMDVSKPSGKPGYENAIEFSDSVTQKVSAIGHELGHAMDATLPGAAESYRITDRANQERQKITDLTTDDSGKTNVPKLIELVNKPNFSALWSQALGINASRERSAVNYGNKIGLQFQNMKSKRIKLLKKKIKKQIRATKRKKYD